MRFTPGMKADKNAIYKTVHRPEEGHWEPILENPDEQEPATSDNNQNNNENTPQNNNDSETNNSQDNSTGKQSPKTGDPTSFVSLYALVGSTLAGIGAVKLKFRKRK